ncbi:MAG: ADP-ribosylglycohydrolase family protein [Propionibacteriaceae bacterium]
MTKSAQADATEPSTTLTDRVSGSLLAAAAGDAIGGATEGWSVEQIHARWGGWVEGIVPPYNLDWQTARPIAPYHKGDGHITDDTLMTRALMQVYLGQRRHLTAYDMAEHLVPQLVGEKVWIPELERSDLLLQRLFLAEKYMALRLNWAHVDPREAGVGNAVNCGAAMYMAPVGLLNIGDPSRAYAEAIELAGAHQSSFGREAAGAFAAAVAAGGVPGASVDSVIETVVGLTHDGTKEAIKAVAEATDGVTSYREAISSGILRDAIRPYDTVADDYRNQGLGARRPSRLHSIEELPVALGMLKIASGDPREAILGATNYGRDSDSIATMAGAIAGAMHGRAALPQDWIAQIQDASQINLEGPIMQFSEVVAEVRAADQDAAREVSTTWEAIVGGTDA